MRGTGANAIVIGDWNGDRIPDLATANPWRDGMVSVLPGCGDGSFTWRKDYPIGALPSALVSCDLNADRKADLVTANNLARTVTVLLGTEDGGFVVQGNHELSANPTALACGDLTGDGIDDLTVTTWIYDEATGTVNTLSVLTGVGDGTLAKTVDYQTVASAAELLLGDLDDDRNLDLVSSTGSVSVRRGNGDGTFGDPLDHRIVGTTSGLALGDLNGDSYPDLGLGDEGGRGWVGGFRMLPGHGDGTFGEIVTYPPSVNVGRVATADLNNDHRLDLVGATYDGISVLLGQDKQEAMHAGAGAVHSTSLAVSDINGDGKLDVVTSDGNYRIYVLLGRGDGTFPE
jgi:hypothetical protein